MTLIKTLQQTRGGSTLEAAVSLPLLLCSLCLMASGLYALFLQSVLHHQTYEYLLCAEFSSANRCEFVLRKQISATVPFGHWQIQTPSTTEKLRQVQIDFSLKLYGNHLWKWNYQNQINRDLSSSSF